MPARIHSTVRHDTAYVLGSVYVPTWSSLTSASSYAGSSFLTATLNKLNCYVYTNTYVHGPPRGGILLSNLLPDPSQSHRANQVCSINNNKVEARTVTYSWP